MKSLLSHLSLDCIRVINPVDNDDMFILIICMLAISGVTLEYIPSLLVSLSAKIYVS